MSRPWCGFVFINPSQHELDEISLSTSVRDIITYSIIVRQVIFFMWYVHLNYANYDWATPFFSIQVRRSGNVQKIELWFT